MRLRSVCLALALSLAAPATGRSQQLSEILGKPAERVQQYSYAEKESLDGQEVLIVDKFELPLPRPVLAESTRLVQGFRIPRLRTTRTFTGYRRFTADSKIQ